MTHDRYLFDAYRSLYKITKDGEEILEYLRKGKLVASLPIDEKLKFSVRIPEQYWINAGMEGIRPLRFPKEFKNRPYTIKVASILPLLVPTLEKIETAQSGGEWKAVGNLGNAWFFGEIEQGLFDPLVPNQCSEIFTQIRRALFLQSNISIKPKCNSNNVKEIKQDAQLSHGKKPGRPKKVVAHDKFWIFVIESLCIKEIKFQKEVVHDVKEKIKEAKMDQIYYNESFIIEQIKVFWKEHKASVKEILKESGK